mgnify:FL=1
MSDRHTERSGTEGTGGTGSVPRHLAAPVSADISITGRCNLECRYCFYSGEMAALSDLSTSQWETAFERLGGARVLRVVLTGGEVFTRSDIFQLIDSVIMNRMRYSILTNGTLIGSDTIREFRVDRRMRRLDSIQVSIDGSRAEVHDRSRPDSFDKALRGLRLLTDSGFPVTARVTISRHNIDDLENIARFLLEDVGLPSFSTCDASPIGTGCTYAGEIALDHRQTLRAGLELEELSRRYPGRITANAGPQARLSMYREMEEAGRTGRPSGRWKMGHFSSCGGVFEKIGILHDGSIVPCSMLHDLRIGNILTDDLLDVWNRSAVMRSVRERYAVPLSAAVECAGCPWVGFCNGGCPGVVQQMRGTLLAPDRRGCYRDFLKENGLESILDVTGREYGSQGE